MSTFIVYFDGRQCSCDSQRDLTHVLLGKRDERKEALPEGLEAKPSNELSNEEREQLFSFTKKKIRQGRYETQVLDWFTNEEDAALASGNWPDHIEMRVQKINSMIPQ